jgi:TolB-like protein
VLHPELAAALGPERFLREIAIAASLNHPHILPLLDSGTMEYGPGVPGPYYVMPYVEGESLRDRLERESQFPLEDAIQITGQIAAALDYAHGRGIIHRDIKPENILLQHGEVVVADFGIARAITEAGGQRLTETGLVAGTPEYMSPEQAAGDRALDARSDQYSLACVTYELLAGEPPFTGPNTQAILARRLTDPVPPLRTVRETVPISVERAITKALAKAPADRWPSVGQFAAALTAPESTRAPEVGSAASWQSRAKWIVGALVATVALGVVGLRARSVRGPVLPAASIVAVLPPTPSTPDTALTRLGQNLAVTLSANLNNVGELRAIDALTVLAQLRGKDAPSTVDEAAALGRRLGASGIVAGTLTRDGTNVRLDLGLYDAVAGAPVARAFVTASVEDINALTDSATWTLLRQVWRAGTAPTPSLAGITTHSIPALRAFLEGEHAIVESRWPEAEQAFGQAVAEDSTFWLAHFRYAYTKGWQLEGLDNEALAPLRAHTQDLPEPERLLMDAWETPGPEGFDKGRLLTERYPDYWPGWMQRADRVFHFGGIFGHPIDEARHGFEQAVELNPRLLPVWEHLAGIAIDVRDPGLYQRAIEATAESHGSGPDSATHPLIDRINLNLLRGGSFAGPEADRLIEQMLASRTAFGSQLAGLLFSPWPAAQVEFAHRMLAGGALPETANTLRQGLASVWASRGAWDSAMIAMDSYAAHSPDKEAKLNRYRLAVIGAWLGGLEPEVAMSRRPANNEWNQLPQNVKSFGTWLDGILAVATHDSAQLHQARARLEEREADAPLAHSLLAFELESHGKRRAAAESLLASEHREEDQREPTVNQVNRLAAARWLAAEGDPARAAALLLWTEANVPVPWYQYRAVSIASITNLEAARIEAARGNIAQARRLYQEFLLYYDQPVPRLRHLVEEAKGALARLESAPATN